MVFSLNKGWRRFWICAAGPALAAHCAAQTAPGPASPLVKAKTIQVTETSYDHSADGRMVPASSSVVLTSGRKISVRRTDPPTTPDKRHTLPDLLFDDGKTLYEINGDRNVYHRSASPDWTRWPRPDPLGFYDTSRLDVVLHPDMPLDPKADPTRMERTVGEAVLDGKLMRVITITTHVKAGEGAPMALTQADQLYIDQATGLPRRSLILRTINGETKELSRVDFSDWVLDRPLPARQFVWEPPAGATDSDTLRLLPVGTPAPDFSVVTPEGRTVHLSDYKGRTVVLDFWATWCGPCQASMPHLERVYQQVKDKGVAVLGVCVWDEKAAYDKWVPLHIGKEYHFPVAFDPAGRGPKSIASGLYKVTGIPTQYVIDKDGRVASSSVGYDGEADHRLEASLNKQGVDIPVPVRDASIR